MIPAIWWPALAVLGFVAAVCWAAAAIVLGVRYDRLRKRAGM